MLILGGGFGGLYAALRLEKTLARRRDVEITLVNRENFFLFTPMLHEVAASDIDLTNIVSPVRKLLRRVNFFAGSVEQVDLATRRVVVSHGSEVHRHALEYDHLVIALGAVTNFYDLPGLEHHAQAMKSLGDAIYLRNHIIAHLEQADFDCCAEMRQGLLTFVVAGGGFAGVETIAAINDFVREAIRAYPNLREDDLRMILVHSGPVILPELGEKLGIYAAKKLGKRKVEIRVNTRVRGASGRGVELSDGTTVETSTLIWTAGTSPNPILDTLPCRRERGRIVVNELLEVPDWPGVWALGDCALVPDRRTGKYCPPTAQHAVREGTLVAHNITAAIRHGRKKAFSFATMGQLAAIGRRTGVGIICGISFSGFFAWWLWRTVYLGKLPRFEKKVRVALDWTLDLLFPKDLIQFMTLRSQAVSRAEDERPKSLLQANVESKSLPQAPAARPLADEGGSDITTGGRHV
ncbi:MAG: NAD(P)/FAD-dependent oxidoreductase [Deltaproteobacteria bacterium]|nr:NAD(P)/FAD-dependent oxidoreductase [Deltaproteobacteria bacterium]